MRAAELAEENCSIARPASLLGDRWTLVILRQAFSRVRRFEDFQSTLGISRSLLTDRLGKLVDAGILRREPYKDEIRTREEYRLTEKGLDLYPVLMALREWGDRYMADDGAPVRVRHRDCGGTPRIDLRCNRCGEEVGAREAEAAPGPGLKAA
ncbi:MAG: winged helix-turn-helix transcriptional regulator [Solirubrobacterales bacterium]